MPNTFDWIEIRTHNVKGTADFYERLFGWKVVDKQDQQGADYWVFDTGSEPRIQNLRRGGFWLRGADEPTGVVPYVVVADIDATLRRVIELGGTVLLPRASQGSAFRAYFEDPVGNVLGLWQEKTGG